MLDMIKGESRAYFEGLGASWEPVTRLGNLGNRLCVLGTAVVPLLARKTHPGIQLSILLIIRLCSAG